MIYTVTLNPAIDETLEVETLFPAAPTGCFPAAAIPAVRGLTLPGR